jgi:hypothetical protein
MTSSRALAMALAAAGALLVPPRLPGCGPFFPSAVFTYTEFPLTPLDPYRGAPRDVIRPSYCLRSLLAAYRDLTGNSITVQEHEILVPRHGVEPRFPARSNEGVWVPEEAREWWDARSKVPGAGPPRELRVFRSVPGSKWEEYPNCPEDAFRTAARTLRDRLQTFGASHSGFRRWLVAQDAVFSNCSEGATMPPPPEGDLPALLRADRVYQIAAARFYAGQFEEAAKGFREIAAEASSPWSRIAPYLAIRALIRKATVTPADRPNLEVLAEAEKQLRELLKDDTRREVHASATGLLSFVRIRLYPQERLRELAEALVDPARASEVRQNFTDFLYLMNRVKFASTQEAGNVSPLVEWMATFRGKDAESFRHSLRRWQETRSLPWLLAAITKAGPQSPELPELVAAAQKTGRDSPAYVTLTYHRIRLLLEAGDRARARELLDAVLPDLRVRLPHSSLNLFLARRMGLAQTLEEFLAYAPRVPAGVSHIYEWDAVDPARVESLGKEGATLFDADSVAILNRFLPLATLRRVVAVGALPNNLRRQLMIVAWTRSVLLDDHQAAQALAGDLGQHLPELKPHLRDYLDADAGSKSFAAVYLLLKFPGFKPYLKTGMSMRTRLPGIDNYRDNWWCHLPAKEDPDVPVTPTPPGFLGAAERERAEQEWKRLAQLETAPNYLSRVVISRARSNPADPRVPETLHLAVKSTRFGCTAEGTSRYSQQAFQLLHRNYPGTEWAKRTKYWF